MNKRIETLMKLASIDGDGLTRVDYVKFAALVAKDCAEIAMGHHYSSSFDEYEDLDNADKSREDTASAISGQIRTAFGVV